MVSRRCAGAADCRADHLELQDAGNRYPGSLRGNRMKLATLLIALILAGCGGTPTATTPAPPNSPQSTLALTVKTVADADNAGVQTVIALRDQGKLSQTNTTTIENWLGFVATTD